MRLAFYGEPDSFQILQKAKTMDAKTNLRLGEKSPIIVDDYLVDNEPEEEEKFQLEMPILDQKTFEEESRKTIYIRKQKSYLIQYVSNFDDNMMERIDDRRTFMSDREQAAIQETAKKN
jgi:hypothetical protein